MNNILNIDSPNKKQEEFFNADTRFVAYGGARGGGKSWAARIKIILLSLNYPGIQILLLRRTYPQLKENHIIPLMKLLKDTAVYKDTDKAFLFYNGSRIKLGYCDNERDVLQYQGQSYDVIFMEEATQFTEFQFQCLTECNRSSGFLKKKFKPRFYLTCNPGGVGHGWVKRLFIDRIYKNSEKKEDYTFIKSLVYDNDFIMKNSPDYISALENLPKERKKAMLYGDWGVYEGQYFSEFDENIHITESFEIPENYRIYFTMDYGLDMLAGYFIAVSPDNTAYIYKEIYEKNLIISDACKKILECKENDNVEYFIAPKDLWNRRQETGKSVAEIFQKEGLRLTKNGTGRIAGWLEMKEWLKPYKDQFGNMTAKLLIFPQCKNLIRTLPQLRYDDKKIGDIAQNPHELTHGPDAIRGFVTFNPRGKTEKKEKPDNLWMFKYNENKKGDENLLW